MRGSHITHRAPQPGRDLLCGRPEDLLIPAAMRPIQFHDIWFRSRTLPPERRLALAVLEETLTDLVRFRFAPGRRAQRLFWQAHDWVTSDDREWPFSFVNLCEAFGLAVALNVERHRGHAALELARDLQCDVLLEHFLERDDLRILVLDQQLRPRLGVARRAVPRRCSMWRTAM